MGLFIRELIRVVATAVQRNVDSENYFSHLIYFKFTPDGS
jgi:hypothetical protein